MVEKYRLVNFPQPPSIHDQYQAITMGGRARIVPTRHLTNFQKACEKYFSERFLDVGMARKNVRDWLLKGYMVRTDFFFFAHETRVYTLKDAPRRYDTSNLVKSIEDELAKLLQIDDCHFFKGSHEKCLTTRSEPFVNIMLRPWKPRSFQDIKEQEGF